MNPPRLLRAAALALPLVLVAAAASACGGGDDSPTVGRDLVVELGQYQGTSVANLVDGFDAVAETSSVLRVPQVQVIESGAGATRRIEQDDVELMGLEDAVDGDDLVTPPGTELVLASFLVGQGSYPDNAQAAAAGDLSAQVETAAGLQPVDLTRTETGPYGPELTLAVVAETGEPVPLSITSAGQTVTLDLRTGSAGDDPRSQQVATASPPLQVEAVGPKRVEGLAVSTFPGYRGLPAAKVTLDAQWDLAQVSREPWLPGSGWAEPDRAWLVATLSVSAIGAPPVATTVGLPPEAYSYAPQGGRRSTSLSAGTVAAPGISIKGDVLVFDVPVGSERGRLTVDPGRGTIPDARWLQAPPLLVGAVQRLTGS